jgi:low affinity Fe/Cu permease
MLEPPHSRFEAVAFRFTRWLGSTSSIVLHTILFIVSFVFVVLGVSLQDVLLVLTTAVSLEAIYLAIFIQMSVNRQAESIQSVEEDIDEIQEDIDEIQEDVDEIQEDVVGISVDIDEISEDVVEDKLEPKVPAITLDTIYADLKRLMDDVEKFKHHHPKS